MYKITIHTNKNYTGVVAGVAFLNGKAKTNDNWKADWFLENGYNVEEEKEEEKNCIDFLKIVHELPKNADEIC